jgi:predicted enzyme related to lactoylglutathione lyase
VSASTRVFRPAVVGEEGRARVIGHAVVTRGEQSLLVAAEPGDAMVSGVVEELLLTALEARRLAAGDDVAIAVVDVAGEAPALALRVPVTPVSGGAAEPVQWGHSSLAVRDLDAALLFYREVLGFAVLFEERGMSRQIEGMTGLEGVSCDLAQLRSPVSAHVLELIAFHGVPAARAGWAPTAPGASHVAFSVERLESALGAVRRAGGTVLGTVTTFESGPAAYCREPSGSFLELSEG